MIVIRIQYKTPTYRRGLVKDAKSPALLYFAKGRHTDLNSFFNFWELPKSNLNHQLAQCLNNFLILFRDLFPSNSISFVLRFCIKTINGLSLKTKSGAKAFRIDRAIFTFLDLPRNKLS